MRVREGFDVLGESAPPTACPVGASASPHGFVLCTRLEAQSHAKSAFIYATVLEGAIRSQVNDGTVTTYEAGQSCSELSGDHHGVNADTSETTLAKLLAVRTNLWR
jgi:quercetin dioxygenase-like cupin family protein